jgi:hypothetical protein
MALGLMLATNWGTAAEAFRLYRNDTYRYEARYPAGWLVWTESKDLEIANFPRNKGLHGGLLPPGGARIAVVRKPETFSQMSREGWINYNLTVVKPEDVLGTKKLALGDKTCLDMHFRTEFGRGVSYDQFSCYLESAERVFRIDMEFRNGDPHQKEYQSAYEAVIRSFKVW